MAKWPYNTANWRKLRLQKLWSQPLCEDCTAEGNTVAATVVDHRHAISQGGAPFPTLDGLASLCASHHSRKTAAGPEAGAVRSNGRRKGCAPDGSPLDPAHPWNGGKDGLPAWKAERRKPSNLLPSTIPLTIVTGPPGSGKSTYVRERVGTNDLVICLDTIMQGLSGLPEHQTPPHLLSKALSRRNHLLRKLGKPCRWDAAWFIIAAPVPRDREWWKRTLGGALVVMDTPAFECVRRINADPSRAGQRPRMIETVLKWWEKNPHLARQFARPPRSENLSELSGKDHRLPFLQS